MSTQSSASTRHTGRRSDGGAQRKSGHDALVVADLAVGALTSVSFTIRPGHILALSGPSGSGKSRLLRALADLDPHGGQIALGDTEHTAVRGHEWRRRVMLVPAESQWWGETVGEHFPAGQVDETGFDTLGFAADVMAWSVSRLSSGEKQRLALLRALAHGPQALLLDEPTANLDADSIARVERLLIDAIHAHGWPVLWVAHDTAQIARVANHHLRIAGDALVAA